jgi:hypothetical protein
MDYEYVRAMNQDGLAGSFGREFNASLTRCRKLVDKLKSTLVEEKKPLIRMEIREEADTLKQFVLCCKPRNVNMKEQFEEFCKEYNLDYDFKNLNNTQYFNQETQKAFIVFKYSEDFRKNKKWSDSL